MNKPKLMIVTDWGNTGFGTVGEELARRFGDAELFDLYYLGWHYNPTNESANAFAKEHKFKLLPTQFWNPKDQFGKLSWDTIIQKIRPDIVLSLGDPWMIEHIANSKFRNSYQWIAYVPIDRDVISKPWLKILKNPDVLVVYSEFGKQVVEDQMPFRHPVFIKHGVDKSIFRPYYWDYMKNMSIEDRRREMKERILGKGMGEKFIVGFVGRNQIRKDVPRTMFAFKAFTCKTWIERQQIHIENPETGDIEHFEAEHFCPNVQCFRCDLCPAYQEREETKNAILYLHTTRGGAASPDGQDIPGIGWSIDEIALRLNLQGKLWMTPKITTLRGLPRAALAQIYSCFDVHLFLTHSEGFGLPIAESIACGVPTFVTNYSSMPEIVAGGGGEAVNVRDFYCYVTWENMLANADIGHAADLVNKVFVDKEYRDQLIEGAVKNDYIIDWNEVSNQFLDVIRKMTS